MKFSFYEYVKSLAVIQPPRYRRLYAEIFWRSPRNILEIGVYRGENARMMITTAALRRPAAQIAYYGFDAFDLLDAEGIKKEFSHAVPALSEPEIYRKLEPLGATVRLYRGYTSDTLPGFLDEARRTHKVMDLIFIDGGHSLETIRQDWDCVKPLMDSQTLVIFDDYYKDLPAEAGDIGCQQLVREIPEKDYRIDVLKTQDRFPRTFGELKIHLMKVRRR